ncbi:PREDICTED: uncharacterized protein LOC108539593 [Rhinopithecus bieti]|uniref:uncharacterized protein LOC108539593 n=1 Tax=Rhinopithecus bieti TaxID=61621 RepID=UPI00083BCBD6|nr:PREDICTED: uncharacterized protein LOC108539593 [Rhinopithecus bieti]
MWGRGLAFHPVRGAGAWPCAQFFRKCRGCVPPHPHTFCRCAGGGCPAREGPGASIQASVALSPVLFPAVVTGAVERTSGHLKARKWCVCRAGCRETGEGLPGTGGNRLWRDPGLPVGDSGVWDRVLLEQLGPRSPRPLDGAGPAAGTPGVLSRPCAATTTTTPEPSLGSSALAAQHLPRLSGSNGRVMGGILTRV